MISHTNTAVNEIKNRIGHHCPKLFSYPNFVGTIQSFIDKFLAVPCYINLCKRKPVRIDNEIYLETIKKDFNIPLEGFNRAESNNAKYFVTSKGILDSFRLHFNGSGYDVVKSINGGQIQIERPKKKNSKNWSDFSNIEKDKIKEWLIKFKKRVFQRGILHFDDAYFFANIYIYKNPKIIGLLQKRFRFVFVDEMQDMEKHQHDLLEAIFYHPLNVSVYQRIGDINQSIFSDSSSNIAEVWTDREPKLTLTGSHRLTPHVANIVQKYSAESHIEISGLNTSNKIKPHIILFDSATKGKVIETFAELIKHYQSNGEIPTEIKNPIKVIGWNGNEPESNKLRIKDYFNTYDKKEQKLKIDYINLVSYLTYYDKKAQTLDPIRKNILNAILKILRLEGIKDDERNFTKRRFLNHLKINFPEKNNLFNRRVFLWSFNIIKGKTGEVQKDIIDFLPGFLCEVFSKQSLNSQSMIFMNEKSTLGLIDAEQSESKNLYSYEDLNIEIATVHSVKGETHTATLYLETCYHKHEAEHCLDAFLGKRTEYKKIKKQASKMMYVGFSRPTHFLCFAALKDRLHNKIEELQVVGWKVILIDENVVTTESIELLMKL